MKLKNGLLLLFFIFLECVFFKVESNCVKGCDVALASYHVMLPFMYQNITSFMQSKIVSVSSLSDVIISYNKDKVSKNGNLFAFSRVNIPFPCECIGGDFLGHVFEYSAKEGDTYDLIANSYYASLTTVELLKKFNSYDQDHIPAKAKVNVTVNCSCGNSQISKDYGLFITYPLRTDDTLQKIANQSNLDEGLIQSYNSGVNFSNGSGIVFIPGRDQNGDYVPLYPRWVILKMDVQASSEFLCELKVLTHVHHLNLVRLIGYCVEGSLFLVYEHIDNGNLGQYLHGTGKEPLPWSSRVEIALDSARGLEYIHEHTVPMYIHRDVKSANILIDKNLRGKVADFGLTKLLEVGNSTLHTRLVGTFGYMPPEYAQYGDVSPKIDVYAFGVVLFELISAKNAVLKTGEFVAESRGLVVLFEEALNQTDPLESLHKLVDPRLREDYPIDSVLKMAQLGRECTKDNPLLRPSMRSIVVSLMSLLSPSEDCDGDTSDENQTIINLLSVR